MRGPASITEGVRNRGDMNHETGAVYTIDAVYRADCDGLPLSYKLDQGAALEQADLAEFVNSWEGAWTSEAIHREPRFSGEAEATL